MTDPDFITDASTASAPSADLSVLDTVAACNVPREIELVHPTSRVGLGFFISIVGKDSDVYRGRIRAMADEALRRQNANLPPLDNSLSKIEAKNIETLAGAITGWRGPKGSGIVTLNGADMKFSAENVRRFLTDLPAAREQVQEAVNDLSGFMPG